ncbi:MAG: YncE family protein [Acidimicrobiales bacterium]
MRIRRGEGARVADARPTMLALSGRHRHSLAVMLAMCLIIALGVPAGSTKTASASSAPVPAEGGELYVVGINSVSVVDLATAVVVRTIKLYRPSGQLPFAVATGIVIEANKDRGLVASVVAGLETVDLSDGEVVSVDRGVVNGYGISPGAQGLAAFVLEASGVEGMPVVVPISATGKALRPVPLSNVPDDVQAISTAPDGKEVYALLFQGLLVPIDTRTLTAGAPFRVPYPANSVAISPDSHFAYVTVGTAPGVVKVNLVDGTTSRVRRFGADPYHIVVTPDGQWAYVSDGDRVFPLDLVTGALGSPISLGPAANAADHVGLGGPLVVSTDGKTVYAAEPSSGTVVPVRVSTGQTGKALLVPGGRVTALAVGP